MGRTRGASLALAISSRTDIWLARTDVPPATQKQIAGTLSETERKRVVTIPAGTKRSRFAVSRGTLRAVLGEYLKTKPEELQILAGPDRRPSLASPQGKEVHFSLSDSGGWVAIAIAIGHKVGVDIELAIPRVDHEQIAARYFGEAELELLAEVHGRKKLVTFYDLWAAKEAWSKAAGVGMAGMGLVEVVPLAGTVTLASGKDRPLACRWSGYMFHPNAELVGAVVTYQQPDRPHESAGKILASRPALRIFEFDVSGSHELAVANDVPTIPFVISMKRRPTG